LKRGIETCREQSTEMPLKLSRMITTIEKPDCYEEVNNETSI